MKQKESRIAKFIESLPEDANLSNCKSTLLATNLNKMGAAGDNGGDCVNDYAKQCNKSKNGGNCKNYNYACADSTNNGSCYSTSGPQPNKPLEP